MTRFGRFLDKRFPWDHNGIVGVMFNYAESKGKGEKKGAEESPGLRFDGKVLFTFASEMLAKLFVNDFDGYMGGDLVQQRRNVYTKAYVARRELERMPAHVRAKKGLTWGQPRFDAEVWECCPPVSERAKAFNPDWETVDREMGVRGYYYGPWCRSGSST